MYKGEVVRELSDVKHWERGHYFDEIVKTKLKAPFEFVKFHFLLEGVTRSFTHQLVRQRTAVYAQESLRFAVKENLDEEVAMPPSLIGLPADHPWRVLWAQSLNKTDDTYNALIADGMPAEDARGLLPHNVTTRVHYSTDLRALQDHAGNRLCTQAQFEWRVVWVRIIEAIRNYRPHAAQVKSFKANKNLPSDIINALEFIDASDSWQYEKIASLFKPVCYLTGKCEFKANFDRPCSIRDRVEANHAIGRPSSEWDTKLDGSTGHEFIGDIQPFEWLTDASAAR
jgi:flavin-dependent thymidylate synthase